MLRCGYKQSRSDHKLFLHHLLESNVTALIVYVDSIATTGVDLEDNYTVNLNY